MKFEQPMIPQESTDKQSREAIHEQLERMVNPDFLERTKHDLLDLEDDILTKRSEDPNSLYDHKLLRNVAYAIESLGSVIEDNGENEEDTALATELNQMAESINKNIDALLDAKFGKKQEEALAIHGKIGKIILKFKQIIEM